MQILVSTGISRSALGFCAGFTATKQRRSARGWAAVFSVGAVLALAGCSYASEALWPSLTGKDPRGGSANPPPTASAPAPRPAVTAQAAAAAPATPAPQTQSLPGGQTTEVGRRAAQLREDLQRLSAGVSTRSTAVQQIRAEAVQTAQTYQGLVGNINARLQVGSTPGNPILQSQWNQASVALDTRSEEHTSELQ